MALTPAGQIFLACTAVFLGAAIWLARRVSQRIRPEGGTSKLLVLIIFVLIALFVPFSYWTGEGLHALATKPSYTATVVGHTSQYRDYDEKDGRGRTVKSRRLVYIAQVRFTGPDHQPLELPNSVASSEPPVEGSQLTVVYTPGDRVATELSTRSVGLWLASSTMVFILGYCLWAMVWYARGHAMAGVMAFGLLFRFLLPVATVLMILGLGYPAIKYFVLGNPDDYPLWVAVVCTLFALSLLPLLVLLFAPKKRNTGKTAWRMRGPADRL